jgi:hypothetical protein
VRKRFNVVFKFINGEYRSFEIPAENYGFVAQQITNSNDGWFGTKGDLVNLNNVLTVTINEYDDNTSDPRSEEAEDLTSWL